MEQTITFGNDAGNNLSLRDHGVLFGFGGDDTLSAQWNSVSYYQAFLLGGQGNDTYRFDGDIATIVDTGGDDSLTLPGSRSDYTGAFLEGRDLMLVNTWTDQGVIILDARGRGTIETFHTEYGETLSFSQVASEVYREGLGDISYRQLEQETGGMFTAENFAAAREINIAWTRMDWDAVWQQLDGRSDDDAFIAETLSARLMTMISSDARQLWYEMGGPQQLQRADFEGVEQHLGGHAGADDGILHGSWPLPREAVEKIALLYEAALDRVPDVGGLNYWIDQGRYQSVEQIAGEFADSDEFEQRFDVATDAEFIDRLYLNVLDRPADAGGRDFWLDAMENGLSKGGVLSEFSDSPENIANAIWLAGLEQTTDSQWVIV